MNETTIYSEKNFSETFDRKKMMGVGSKKTEIRINRRKGRI